jgi:hypothetical protein
MTYYARVTKDGTVLHPGLCGEHDSAEKRERVAREYPYAEPADWADVTGNEEAVCEPESRLESIRASIRAENVAYSELAELQGLTEYISPGDVELLEWAGVPEFDEEPKDD